MPRPDDSLQWIEFTDFSPGIFSNNNLAGGVNVTSTNPAMAQEQGTFRCMALPTGGLGPLPRLRESYGFEDIPGIGVAEEYQIAGFSTWGRILDVTGGYECHVALYYENASVPGPFDVRLGWYRERKFGTSPGTEEIHSETLSDVSSSAARYTYFMKTRMNPTTPDDPGIPVMVGVFSRVNSNDIEFTRAWPDPDNPGTNDTIIVGDPAEDIPYVIAAAHQGRIVLGEWRDYAHGVDADLITNENLWWTATNDNTLSGSEAAVFVPEIDQSISDMAAMSANSMLVVKFYGGGYVLQGDLDDVTVVQLPNLPCPDSSDYVRGANTSKGYIYSAGPAGMYLWNGGDGAELISPQLDGDFALGDNFISGANGQCDRWIDRVLVPQNWIYDTNMGSWWRIEDPEIVNIRYWSTLAATAIAVGAETTFTEEEPEFMHEFQYADLAYTWSWLSHPLWATQGRRIECRQGIAALQGHGTVTITITDELGNISQQIQQVAHDEIRNYRWNIGQDAENLIVKIEASGDVGEGPGTSEAPLLHRLFIGYTTAQHLATSS
jgi:hypothetical protein